MMLWSWGGTILVSCIRNWKFDTKYLNKCPIIYLLLLSLLLILYFWLGWKFHKCKQVIGLIVKLEQMVRPYVNLSHNSHTYLHTLKFPFFQCIFWAVCLLYYYCLAKIHPFLALLMSVLKNNWEPPRSHILSFLWWHNSFKCLKMN